MGKYHNSTITFNARRQNQRTGATIVGSTVYFGFSSHCDLYYFAGWILGYDINTFKLVGEHWSPPLCPWPIICAT
jgi:hypothetical protein